MRIGNEAVSSRLEYLWWATKGGFFADKTCPGCGGTQTRCVRRKYLVTSLWECATCQIRFRAPKETASKAERLYRSESYRQGFTTDMPPREVLERHLATRFAGTELDYASRIGILQSFLPKESRILDFGSSWGYGSWQISQAGFEVLSYEIGERRAQYAAKELGCRIVTNLTEFEGTIDCFFTSHVIEHLPDPNLVFVVAARMLVRGGLFVCFCPNGNPARETVDPDYNRLWGQVHPLFITPGFMRWACNRYGFELCDLPHGRTLLDSELLTLARVRNSKRE